MSSRLVAAKPLRAKASVAAVRICSRRCNRGRRRTGSGLSTATVAPSFCISENVYFVMFNLKDTNDGTVGARRHRPPGTADELGDFAAAACCSRYGLGKRVRE